MSAFATAAPGTRHTPTPPWERVETVVPGWKAYDAPVSDGSLCVIVSKDDGMWHMSISHTDRLPSWDEIADARYRFLPDRVTMAQLLPPRAEWVDVHPRTLHLWQIEAPGSPSGGPEPLEGT